MTTIVVDGREHDLGLLMHWRKEPHLNSVLPRNLDVSLAWVRLENGQVLDPHIHPVASLVVCCQGAVRSIGELETEMSEGDIMIIPPGEQHGFVGAGLNGFWGLSIQFESLALYEDLDSPLVTFVEDGSSLDSQLDAVTLLLQKNAHFTEQFSQHRLLAAIDDGAFDDEARRSQLLNHLQIWSDLYQKMLFCRAAFTDNSKFASVARLHLNDEFGHDESLRDRPGIKPVWDPVVDAAGNWFMTKMLSTDEAEKTVLVHLVLESAASIFYARFADTAAKARGGIEHFDSHSSGQVDTEHIKIGVDALREVPLKDHGPLMEAQIRGWMMFTTLFDRLAELCLDHGAMVPAGTGPAGSSG
jgi:quercetin dioxygenase-like cupin family protein